MASQESERNKPVPYNAMISPVPDSRNPVPDSRNPVPDSRNPVPDTEIPLPDTDDSELSLNSFSRPVATRNMKRSTGWLHSPGRFRVLALTEQDLLQVALARGLKVSRFHDLKYVRAGRKKGTMEVYVWPTTENDPERIQIQHGKSAVWINLISLLANEQMTLEPGIREQYVVRVVGEESPAKHAIMFDMGRPTDRRSSGKAKPKNDAEPNHGGETHSA